MKKKLSIILIILGLLILAAPSIMNKIVGIRINKENEFLDNLSAQDLANNENLEAEYDYSTVRDLEFNTFFSHLDASYDKAIIGQISIPDLDIYLPILKGTTNANLLVGATTMVPHQQMGEGNYPLAGHYMKDKNLLFGNLLNIKKNTIVRLTDKRIIYEYKIYETTVVSDTAHHMIGNQMAKNHGQPILSLMTCYYTSKSGQRFFALGELIDEYPYEKGLMYP
ncbi:class A sortase [Irregularibacter muris]|uniref:Class A sortase n=1 Tax=Irregularibacter muris TaxID=1796619 RepID=A0AAE3HIX8_9FIRM|nr:class A sortase [Irregularibacter muris]MCR1900277.1 class A sortase [Irregularibacter muris]